MALLDFPSAPQNNDTYTFGGNTWKWNGTSWVAFNNLSLSSQVSGVLGTNYGGTGKALSGLTVGSILYADSSSSFAALAPSTSNYVLATQGAGNPPYWKIDDSGTGSVGNGTTYGFTYYNGLNTVTSGTAFSYIVGSGSGGTGGTVILTSSTMALVGSTITSGTWAGSAITAKYGGTGLTTLSAGDLIYGSTTDTYSRLTHSGFGNSILVTYGTSSIGWTAKENVSVGSATNATNATNISGGTQYNLVYQSNASTTGFVGNAAGGGASVLTQTGNATPVYLGQSQLSVGSATNATNISGGTQYNVVYQSNANTTGFVGNAAGGGASVLTQTGNATPVYLGQSQLSVGSATNATNISGGTQYNLVYQSNASATGFIGNAAGGGASVLTQTGNATPVYIGQSQLSVGSATNATNATNTAITDDTTTSSAQYITWVGGTSSNQAQKITSSRLTFVPSTGVLTASSFSGSGANLTSVVNSLSSGTGILVSGSTGSVTVTNIGVQTISGSANQISASGSTGTVTLSLANTVSVADITLTTGSNSTLATVGSQSTSLVNKQYVDNLASGLDIHGSVRAILVTGIGGSYVQSQTPGSSAIGASIIATVNGAFPSIDGVTFSATGTTQRVLIAGGATGKTNINGNATWGTPTNINLANGIYYIYDLGSVGSKWILVRATDTDDNTELTGGTFCFVEEGSTYADTGWVCSNDTTNYGPIQFGLDNANTGAINFTQFTGAPALTIGQGLSKVGQVIATNFNINTFGPLTGGVGYTAFTIGGSQSGVAGTASNATLRVGTATTWGSGSAIISLNTTGFSMSGGTNTTATLTLTGNISLSNPGTQYAIAYASDANTVSFTSAAAGSGASVLTQTTGNTPVYLGQSQLSVGSATNATNISGGTQYNVVYQSNASTTGFVGNAAGGGASVLTQTGNATPVYLGQSQLSVGSATNISGGTQYNLVYQSNASTTGFVGNAAGGGASVLTQTGNATPVYLGQSQLSVGSATNATNISGGTQYNVVYQSNANTTGFVGNAAGGGASVLTQTGNATPVYLGQSQLSVGSATNATNISGGTQYNLVYQSNASATGFIGNAAGGGASVLTQTGNATPVYIGQSQLSVGSATNATTATNLNLSLATGLGVSYLVCAGGTSGSQPTYSATGITVSAAASALYANNLIASGSTAASSTTTGALIVNGGVGIGGSIWTSALNFASISSVGMSNGIILSGTWNGSVISNTYGGTNNNIAGSGWSNKVAVYNGTGFGITAFTHTPGDLIIGATGGTFAGLASTLVPVVGIGSNPPPRPAGAIGNTQAGQLWWDSNYGVLKVYFNDGDTQQWVDATPVLGSSGGGSSTKRSYVMTFGAGFTPSTGADTVQILVPYAPDNTSKFYYIKRLDYRNETLSTGAGVTFFIERFSGGNAAFTSPARIHTVGSGVAGSFVVSSTTYTTSYTLAATGASFISSSGVAASIISGDYLRLNFTAVNSAATLSVSIVIEEQ